jgi:hypothetical protein
MNSTKQARQLTRIQIDILSCIYTFRFGTTELLASSLGKKSGATIHPRLVILERDGYLARRFDASYRLQHKPAAYYLTPYGLRTLRRLKELPGLSDTAIKNSYKDATATDQFITHSLNVFMLANQLISLDDKLRYFTKREQVGYEYFPSPPPDGFVSLKLKEDETPKRFFLELIEPGVPAFAIDRLITRLVTYEEEGGVGSDQSSFPACFARSLDGISQEAAHKTVTSSHLPNRHGGFFLLYDASSCSSGYKREGCSLDELGRARRRCAIARARGLNWNFGIVNI